MITAGELIDSIDTDRAIQIIREDTHAATLVDTLRSAMHQVGMPQGDIDHILNMLVACYYLGYERGRAHRRAIDTATFLMDADDTGEAP